MRECIQCIRLNLLIVFVQQNKSDALTELIVKPICNSLCLKGVFRVEVGSAVAELVIGHANQILGWLGASLVSWTLLHFYTTL